MRSFGGHSKSSLAPTDRLNGRGQGHVLRLLVPGDAVKAPTPGLDVAHEGVDEPQSGVQVQECEDEEAMLRMLEDEEAAAFADGW